MNLGFRSRLALIWQRTFGLVMLPVLYPFFWGWLYFGRGYRIANLRDLRRKFQELLANDRRPIIFCANHLTMIDSFFMIWGFNSIWRYFRSYHLFPWNVPEKDNFSKNLAVRLMCFWGKCILIRRQGPKAQSQLVLDKIAYLLKSGENVIIFPEGKRSRSGRVEMESTTYGVGKILLNVPEARVVCCYLRGREQEGYSFIPKYGEILDVHLEELVLQSSESDRRKMRDFSVKIMERLIEMEEKYYLNVVDRK